MKARRPGKAVSGSATMAVPRAVLMLDPTHPCKQAASTARALPLLKLPVPWLLRLAGQHLDGSSKKACFQSCTRFRDLIVANSDNVQCKLSSSKPVEVPTLATVQPFMMGQATAWVPPQPSEITPSAAAQVLRHLNLCKEGAAVKLTIQGPPSFSEGDRVSAFQFWLQQLCTHASQLPGLPLKHVTSVEIQGTLTGFLIPPSIAMHCPNMKAFTRTADMKPCPNTPAPITWCLQLQELEFSSAFKAPRTRFGLMPKECRSDAMPEQMFLQQLQFLPNLHSVTCEFDYYEGECADEDAVQWVFRGLGGIAHQLTRLCIRPYECSRGEVEVPTPLLTTTWPQLKCLEMPQVSLSRSQAMQLQQQAPQLTDLAVFKLEVSADMTYKQCKWQRLSIGTVNFELIAELSLPALRELRFGCLHTADTDVQDAEAAMKVLEQLRTVCPDTDDDSLPLQFHSPPPSAGASQVLEVLRRLHTGHLKLLGNAPHALDGCWLQLLGQLGSHTLTVHPDAIKHECWAEIPRHFPTVKALQVHQGKGPYHAHTCSGILGAQLTAVCICADRCLTLSLDKEVFRKVGRRWKEQAEAFIKAGGQEQVSICFLQPEHDACLEW